MQHEPQLLELARHCDVRGTFRRLAEVNSDTLDFPIVSVNASVSHTTGTVRGLHLQVPPFAETKMVACVSGRVFDVVVDVRQTSPRFAKWTGWVLEGNDANTAVIPPGFAHGFQVLEAPATIIYAVSAPHSPAHEVAISATDPYIGITWPVPPTLRSLRDQEALNLLDLDPDLLRKIAASENTKERN
jgi:dTDP-4-dehydrorhamnose 3,5-epimerase